MKRYAMSPSGKRFELTDAMIDLRNRLAVGLGFVLRPCSMGPCSTGEHYECWEKPPLDYEHRGRMISSYHCHPMSPRDMNGDVEYMWPGDTETAAYAIDRGKPLPDDPNQPVKSKAKPRRS